MMLIGHSRIWRVSCAGRIKGFSEILRNLPGIFCSLNRATGFPNYKKSSKNHKGFLIFTRNIWRITSLVKNPTGFFVSSFSHLFSIRLNIFVCKEQSRIFLSLVENQSWFFKIKEDPTFPMSHYWTLLDNKPA